MADEKEERDYAGTKYDMKLLGSGWLKETRGKRKFQRFVLNEAIELEAKDVLCAFVARNRRNENSPNYYLFLDTDSRERRHKKEAAKEQNEEYPDRGNDADEF